MALNNIELLRKKRKMNKKELATKLNVSPATITLWEKGVNNPNPKRLEEITKVLRCRVQDVYKMKEG